MTADTLGIIFAHEQPETMRELIRKRSCASVPFGARYRLIDFTLSSMIGSGINTVGVITQNNYYSLMEHLGTGKEWDLNRKRGGLTILPPADSRYSVNRFGNSKISLLMGVMDYIKKSNCKYVIISDSNLVANINFKDILNAHIKSRAYMTALYKSNVFQKEKFISNPFIEIDKNGKIIDVTINQEIPLHNKMLLGTYVIEKELLEFLLYQCAAHNKFDFERDILQVMSTSLDILGFEHTGYAEKIDSVSSYFLTSLELLDEKVRKEIFNPKQEIITKIHDQPPSFFGQEGCVKNCILADGCSIEGTVENSVIFRNVKIGKGSLIKNCIIMQGAVIGDNSELSYCIIDKNTTISRSTSLFGAKKYPLILPIGQKI